MIGMVVVAEKQIDCFGGQGLVIDRYIPAGVGFNNAILGAIGLATVHVEDCPERCLWCGKRPRAVAAGSRCRPLVGLRHR